MSYAQLKELLFAFSFVLEIRILIHSKDTTNLQKRKTCHVMVATDLRENLFTTIEGMAQVFFEAFWAQQVSGLWI